MAYVYGRLKEALLGNSGDKVAKDLSPNMIKAIFIGRDSIVLVYHTRACKIVPMDVNKVVQELGSGNARNESLNNVLNKYKMGCVEEVYADSAYRTIQGGYLDLNRYVGGLSRCRLRFYGWYSGDAKGVVPFYEKARSEHNYLYCAANDAEIRGKVLRIEAQEVSGKAEKWYKVHDVRPMDYPIDKTLEKYFNQVDGYIKDLSEKQEAAVREEGVKTLLKELIDKEISRAEDYQMYSIIRRVGVKYGDYVGDALENHFYGLVLKPGVKMINVESYTKGKLTKEQTNVEKILARDTGTVSVKDVTVEELKKRLDSGSDLWGAKKACYDRMTSFVKYCCGKKALFLIMYIVMDSALGGVKPNMDSMLTAIEELFKKEDWLSTCNIIICKMIGFSSYKELQEFVMKVLKGGSK